ncbi:MAG: hypothetical protein LBE36_13930 [Flavobacteriaceae bacterium]|nr:hypothetical protein [Flavobacteriaceae bacterium]
MSLLKLILTVIIIFFVWNILKRLFFNSFYKFTTRNDNMKTSKKEKMKPGKHGLNWDAETIDYEEIKEDDKNKKK